MRVKLPVIVQDQVEAAAKGMPPVETFYDEGEDVLLDGPVSNSLAVLDFDPKTGRLGQGARFRRGAGKDPATYAIADEANLEAPDFMQVNVFATVLSTMRMFEHEDTLGRPIRWAFDAPQLLIVPRAGEWQNAFYERESHSLQFFHFPSESPGKTIYTSLSRDIVSHEAGHAILDGIARDLYNAITPQSLALHEAIADLTALVMAFNSPIVRETVLDQEGGSIRNSTAFTRIASEFGQALNPERPRDSLRNLLNDRTLDDPDVDTTEPHDLSEVLTGALYTVMVKLHEDWKARLVQEGEGTDFSVSGKALFTATRQFQRMVFRALDYLPPGEISFVDYGRAIVASDQAAHPESAHGRDWLREEFVKRAIVRDAAELDVPAPSEEPALAELDLKTLIESDWAAYDFANRNRKLFGLPADVPFEVRPRFETKKLVYHRGEPTTVHEVLFKVAWRAAEKNPEGRWFTDERLIAAGTTLAIEWGEPPSMLRMCLTTRLEDQRAERDRFLLRLDDEGVLLPGPQATSLDDRPLSSVVQAEVMGGRMRVRGAARTLHVAPRDDSRG